MHSNELISKKDIQERTTDDRGESREILTFEHGRASNADLRVLKECEWYVPASAELAAASCQATARLPGGPDLFSKNLKTQMF